MSTEQWLGLATGVLFRIPAGMVTGAAVYAELYPFIKSTVLVARWS
jgi:hypothetical protein